MGNMLNISPHITWGEATSSATAKQRGILNIPEAAIVQNMKVVADGIFEKVRAYFNAPIKVTSFFRCGALNRAIGGSDTSQHVKGQALDMDGDVYGSPSNVQIFEYIRDNLVFDQMIIEGIVDGKIAWVHCSLTRGVNRNSILFMYYSKNGKTVPAGTPGCKKIYEAYSLERYHQLIY